MNAGALRIVQSYQGLSITHKIFKSVAQPFPAVRLICTGWKACAAKYSVAG